jgi:hypothetical protein
LDIFVCGYFLCLFWLLYVFLYVHGFLFFFVLFSLCLIITLFCCCCVCWFLCLVCIVFDGFLGSGTTMVACENLGRRCMGIEVSPGYVAVALERMAAAFPGIVIECVGG